MSSSRGRRGTGSVERGGGIDLKSALLPTELALLPTPMADESDPTDEMLAEITEANGRDPGRLWLDGRKWMTQRTLSRVVPALLPTPHGFPKEGQPRNPGPTGNELGRSLGKLLPTPLAGDAEGGRTSKGKDRPDETGLRKTLERSSGANTDPPSSDGKRSSGGLRLNPSFVEWMMGAPEGWTDPGCRLSATEFSSRPDGSAAGGSSNTPRDPE